MVTNKRQRQSYFQRSPANLAGIRSSTRIKVCIFNVQNLIHQFRYVKIHSWLRISGKQLKKKSVLFIPVFAR